MKFKVQMTAMAEQDLTQIGDYIAFELQEPKTAMQLIGKLKEEILSLDELPERHEPVGDKYWEKIGLRKFPVSGYIIFYAVDNELQIVNVIRVLSHRKRLGAAYIK